VSYIDAAHLPFVRVAQQGDDDRILAKKPADAVRRFGLVEERAENLHRFGRLTAGKSNGVGLGLAFSRQAVIEHGGDMWGESSRQGASFSFTLPGTGSIARRAL
jgi:light-regulated signal transduction histidine kinase (bacteriophytochrome)